MEENEMGRADLVQQEIEILKKLLIEPVSPNIPLHKDVMEVHQKQAKTRQKSRSARINYRSAEEELEQKQDDLFHIQARIDYNARLLESQKEFIQELRERQEEERKKIAKALKKAAAEEKAYQETEKHIDLLRALREYVSTEQVPAKAAMEQLGITDPLREWVLSSIETECLSDFADHTAKLWLSIKNQQKEKTI